MNPRILYFSEFLRDTSLLVVIAYLIARGRSLRLLFRTRMPWREAVLPGLLLGVAGLAVSFFPESHFPFATHTLFATFATLAGGLPVGLIAACIISFGVGGHAWYLVCGTITAVFTTVALMHWLRRPDGGPPTLSAGLLAGAVTQSIRLCIHLMLTRFWHAPPLPFSAVLSIPANGFGVALLLMVIRDAYQRAAMQESRLEMKHRLAEAERANALASQAQLSALRARVHPHFLFNALNAIAELCVTAPERAEIATLNLSSLMRRALEADGGATIPLAEEIAFVRAYLDIQKERLGDRLKVRWRIDVDCQAARIVPFSVQILVENAIAHGLYPLPSGGTITITARRSGSGIMAAVQDNGPGICPEKRRQAQAELRRPEHGLQILNQLLCQLYGKRSRLRIASNPGIGTLACFVIPGGGPSAKEPEV